VIEQDETMATTHRLQTPLALNARYFWRVTPLNGCGAGPAADGRLQTAVGIFLPLVMQ
jgi:hypothetical protein